MPSIDRKPLFHDPGSAHYWAPFRNIPKKLDLCRLWLDSFNLRYPNGAELLEWKDKSKQIHSTTATLGQGPEVRKREITLHNSPSIYFDGSEYMESDLPQVNSDFSIFLVFKPEADGVIFSQGNTGSATQKIKVTYTDPDVYFTYTDNAGVTCTLTVPVLFPTRYECILAIKSGNDFTLLQHTAVEDTAAVVTGAITLDQTILGAEAGPVVGNNFIGFIPEISVFDLALNPAERVYLLSYFLSKYLNTKSSTLIWNNADIRWDDANFTWD